MILGILTFSDTYIVVCSFPIAQVHSRKVIQIRKKGMKSQPWAPLPEDVVATAQHEMAAAGAEGRSGTSRTRLEPFSPVPGWRGMRVERSVPV
jgi:hypothetical protein